MKFAMYMPNGMQVAAITQPWQRELGGPEIARAVKLADQLGYDEIKASEHFLMPEEHLALSGSHWPAVTISLAFLGAHAPNLRLTSNVSLLALQHPIVTAKTWATLDWLTGGRAQMHIGVGWLREEFDVLGVEFGMRGRIVDEYVRALLALWTDDLPSFEGEFVSFPAIAADPKPVQRPHIPLVFGGDANPVLRRVARWGAGWAPNFVAPRDYAAKLDYIRSQPEYDGRELELHLGLAGLKVGDEHRPNQQGAEFDTWNAAELIDSLNGLVDLGVTNVTMAIPRMRDFEEFLDRLRWEAEEVFPHVR